MKTKTLLYFLLPVIISGVLVSCSSSNRVASNFSKRKYTKGFFFDRITKAKAPARNNMVSAIFHKSAKSAIKAPVVTSRNTACVSNSSDVVIVQKQIQAISKKSAFVHSVEEVINSEPANTTVTSDASSSSSTVKIASRSNYVNQAPSEGYRNRSSGGSCKSWIAALLLCIFLGGIGIHRFYLGYIWQGIVQLLTLGGCGVWTLIDFIRIIMKTLKPKNGDYCE